MYLNTSLIKRTLCKLSSTWLKSTLTTEYVCSVTGRRNEALMFIAVDKRNFRLFKAC